MARALRAILAAAVALAAGCDALLGIGDPVIVAGGTADASLADAPHETHREAGGGADQLSERQRDGRALADASRDASDAGVDATTPPPDAAGNDSFAPPYPDPPDGAGTGTTYYVSAGGADTNDGKSKSSAWHTLAKVNAATFMPGDTILFEGGVTFTGCLDLLGSAIGGQVESTSAQPLTVGSYGGGARFKISADCTGTHVGAITIASVNGLILRDCTVLGNDGGAPYGIYINNDTMAPTQYVRVEGCDVSGFFGVGANSGAEIFVDGIPGGLDQVILLDNTLHGSSGPTSPDDNGIDGYGNGANITGALYQGNTIYDIGGRAAGGSSGEGNGIVLNGINGGTVRDNVIHDCGGNVTACGGPGGIVALNANDLTIERNEVYAMGPVDAGTAGCGWIGIELESPITNSTAQYNYVHDNEQGAAFQTYITTGWSGNAIRYNIGQNNASEVVLGGLNSAATDVIVLNNTFYEKAGNGGLLAIGVNSDTDGGASLGGTIANNILFSAGNGPFLVDQPWSAANVSALSFVRNDYFTPNAPSIIWGATTYPSVGAWAAATGQETAAGGPITSDPELVMPGVGGTIGGYDPLKLAGYELLSTSPLLGAGAAPSVGSAPQDFFGNTIPSTSAVYDIGAYGGTGVAP